MINFKILSLNVNLLFFILINFIYIIAISYADDLNGASRATFPHIDGLIYRETSGNTACNPTYACQGINIFEIPYIFDHVSSNFVNTNFNNLFDMRKTQTCFANKRILVLGDSVL